MSYFKKSNFFFYLSVFFFFFLFFVLLIFFLLNGNVKLLLRVCGTTMSIHVYIYIYIYGCVCESLCVCRRVPKERILFSVYLTGIRLSGGSPLFALAQRAHKLARPEENDEESRSVRGETPK